MLRTCAGQVAGHRVHRVGQVLPRAGNAGHVGLAAQPAFAADLARHARYFAGETVQLVHHRVERFLELQNFAADVHGDLARKVAAGDCRRHFGDVAHLAGQVAGHEVHVVGEVLPRAADAGHLRLAAQFSFRADFARDARHFAGERVELVHHRVDGVFQFENFALHVHRDLARQVAARHGRGHFGDVAHLRRQVSGHRVNRVGQVLPRARHARHHGLPAQPAFRADLARHARHFRSERSQLIHHRVDGFFELQNFAAHIHRDLARQIAAGHGGGHFRDVADLPGEVAGHRVHRVGEVLPRSGHAGNLRLSAQFAVGAHFARHARDFSRKDAELLNHRIDDIRRSQKFALQRPAIHVQPDRLRQVTLRDGSNRARNFRRRDGAGPPRECSPKLPFRPTRPWTREIASVPASVPLYRRLARRASTPAPFAGWQQRFH